MKTFEENLAKDVLKFGKNITQNIFMNTWQRRVWGAWQVLNGNAGIIILRIDPKVINN